MILNTMDYIVRNNLLRQGKPLHFYLQSLIYGCEALSELTMDDLKIVHTQILPIDENGAAELPESYNDYVGCFIKTGQKLQPLTYDDSINPLNNYDADFNITRWDNPTTNSSNDQSVVQISGLLNTWWFGFSPYDSLGEPTGRFFGVGNPTNLTFKIIKERNKIQLNERMSATEIVFQWVGDGRNSDAVSSVESYALDTIRNYINYRLKDFNRSYSRGEVEQAKQEYINSRKILRARKSDLTMTALRQIIYKNTRLSPSK